MTDMYEEHLNTLIVKRKSVGLVTLFRTDGRLHAVQKQSMENFAKKILLCHAFSQIFYIFSVMIEDTLLTLGIVLLLSSCFSHFTPSRLTPAQWVGRGCAASLRLGTGCREHKAIGLVLLGAKSINVLIGTEKQGGGISGRDSCASGSCLSGTLQVLRAATYRARADTLRG